MHKRVAILQSNYIPWKGYFDLIDSVDEFIIYDDVQYTKNDWRNRNKIKTPNGLQWLTVPVGQNISRKIREVKLPDSNWQIKHWKTIEANYSRASHFDEIKEILEPLYCKNKYNLLSQLNRVFIDSISRYLGIRTLISDSGGYLLKGDRTERLVNICKQAGATEYVSGPAAKAYIDEDLFERQKIQLSWFRYSAYPEYPQLWGDFVHAVSIIDLMFNMGKEAAEYFKQANRCANLPSSVPP